VQDPLIGRLVDLLQRRDGGWATLLCLAALGLSAGLVMLFSPPQWSETGLLVWLALCLLLVYTSHSLINVCYLTWGTRLSDDPHERTRIAGWREAAGLLGVLAASSLPALWLSSLGERSGYQLFAWLFVVVLGVCIWITLTFTPRPRDTALAKFAGWRWALTPRSIRRVLWFYLFNAMAVATPATLVLFYIDDVLLLPQWAGLFLGLYFCMGALALPVWIRLADRFGKPRTWLLSTMVSILALFCVYFLNAGDLVAYSIVCMVAGTAVGADLVLPVAMLADAIPASHRPSTGIYFGLWALIAKLALALSAGLTLPLLSSLGYVPGNSSSAWAVISIYAFLPALLKAVAIWIMSPDILPVLPLYKESHHET
jgi:Na+/melibiose symporter-like transporter